MKSIIKSSIIVASLLLFAGCKKYEMIKYEKGDQINFMTWDNLNREIDDPAKFIYKFNFGVNPKGELLKADTLLVGVKVMGVPEDYPRKVVFKLKSPSSNGLRVNFMPEGYIVPAGKGTAAFKVAVLRPAKQNITHTAELEFDYAASDFKPGTLERQSYKLESYDIVDMESWNLTPYEWTRDEGILGDWSEAKARFIITNIGCVDFTVWSSIYSIMRNDLTVTLPALLRKYKADNLLDPEKYPPLWDETKFPAKVWITFPYE